MREWYSAREIAAAATESEDFPSTERAVKYRAEREAWRARPRQAKGGGVEYHVGALPKPIQRALYKKSLAPQTNALTEVRSESPAAMSPAGALALALPG